MIEVVQPEVEDMMKKFLTLALGICALSLFHIQPADAGKRLGGGKSVGTQREAPKQTAAPAKAPQQAQPAAPATPPAAPAGNKWLGPLAGLAIGAGLASLFMGGGLGGLGGLGSILSSLLMVGAVVMLALFLYRMFRSKNEAPLAYAGAGQSSPHTHYQAQTEPSYTPSSAASHSVAATTSGAAAHSVATTTAADVPTPVVLPEGFNAEQFLHHARLNFVRLQRANDTRDSSTLAEMLTPSMMDEVKTLWLSEPANTTGQTEVVSLNAEMLAVVTEGLLYIASVRFTGMIREDGAATAEAFNEIWHLEKPLRGDKGWMVSGIQQA